jgi:hypothetical protein
MKISIFSGRDKSEKSERKESYTVQDLMQKNNSRKLNI